MRRKPSGSHCVQKTPDETYRPFERDVARRRDARAHRERPGVGRLENRERRGVDDDAIARQRAPSSSTRTSRLLLAVEHERRAPVGVERRGIAAERERRGDVGGVRVEIELER